MLVYQFINPTPKGTDFISEDDEGYNRFMIVRSSQYEHVPSLINKRNKIERARYQVFTIYSEKIGIFHGEEFLVERDMQGVRAHTIGQKCILFSKQIVFESDWSNIKNSYTISHRTGHNNDNEISGCDLIINIKKNEDSYVIPLIDSQDDSESSQFNFRSEVVLSGR